MSEEWKPKRSVSVSFFGQKRGANQNETRGKGGQLKWDLRIKRKMENSASNSLGYRISREQIGG